MRVTPFERTAIRSFQVSSVASAIIDAVEKHNKRNPGEEVLFFNYAAVTPAFTNERCSFWHFRFDAHADMKMNAITDYIKANDDIKKVYLIGQDYIFGEAVAAAAEGQLGEKRPDIEIVGNELHPLGKVKDFTPYIQKIIASEADAVITGNWGSDMVGLGKAIIEAGFTGPIYTYYAASNGITRTFGEAGVGKINLVGEGALNPAGSPEVDEYVDAFEAKYPDHDISQPRIANVVRMLAMAIEEAGTATDVVEVAKALEGMETDNFWGGKIKMRAEDHQAIQDVYVMEQASGLKHLLDNSDYGLETAVKVEMASADIPTTCEMERPE